MTATQREAGTGQRSSDGSAAGPARGPVWLLGYLTRRAKALFGKKKTPADLQGERAAKEIRALKLRVDLLHRALISTAIGGRVIATDDPLAPLSPLEFLACPGATTTVFTFSGLAASSSDPSKEFYRSLSRHKVNVIFVKDFQSSWYQRGLLGVSESVDATARHLLSLVPEGQTKIVTVGASAGGFAAILFGTLMKADRVAAFSPQTRVTAEAISHFRGLPAKQAQSMIEESTHPDLRDLLASTEMPGRIDIHYGLKHARDSKDAQYLKGFSCVRLIGHDSAGHMIADFLKRSGKLDGVLAELCAS